jgi:hypothetical protein
MCVGAARGFENALNANDVVDADPEAVDGLLTHEIRKHPAQHTLAEVTLLVLEEVNTDPRGQALRVRRAVPVHVPTLVDQPFVEIFNRQTSSNHLRDALSNLTY